VDMTTGAGDQWRYSILYRLKSVKELARQTGKCGMHGGSVHTVCFRRTVLVHLKAVKN